MKNTYRTLTYILIAALGGWLANELVASRNSEISMLSSPAHAQVIHEIGSDAKYTKFFTAGADGKTVAVWVFERKENNIQHMPVLVKSKVFTAAP